MSALEAVFGHDVKLDAAGKPIEKGIGALIHRAKDEVAKVEAEVVEFLDPQLVAERDTLKERLQLTVNQFNICQMQLLEVNAALENANAKIAELTKLARAVPVVEPVVAPVVAPAIEPTVVEPTVVEPAAAPVEPVIEKHDL